ncbi:MULTISPECIES: oligopeptide/dipeptide ABC transporter ATP-binding protein [unclassified Herbaspirillum]|uniref:ABC transporter ATP-binding protein n=1 Tax=unclassified Herbaspirillum TaxID=2624150 RepID=UPI000E2FB688|nr:MULTISPECIES: oligopeptide/dipeptide ABC transporter ATP-binding protein [unclassified Herbaspirillum]RFB71172.1 ATP-binding cassette domain-containing protein [Herbaspirillum sp. 3R-3a1]TFI08297.1 ATP-binding cassette domain-containing protein [Herbaspirillum sp. 3R11]TFI14712.1 ATP-binding cassette domain-containing protein [Herbaspirillum sp. 3R-11]TFI31896.1 ATP-binding cassette domain-containing protein [Herbaspirillum sp. 3C11]TFI32021.1 ATP-binding cassette domain-containing protein 
MSTLTTSDSLIRLDHISKRFTTKRDLAGALIARLSGKSPPPSVHAVDDVSLQIAKGEVLGLVGESGCGKSTLGRVVAGIHTQSSGDMQWKGTPVGQLDAAGRKRQSLAIQMIFQDPMASLNPRMRVRDIIGEAPLAHGLVKPAALEDYVDDVMLRVGLDPTYQLRYPHQFSGGQRQRIGIARALAVQPEFLVCDESVAALDVSIQAQVINLFMRLREEFNLTYLFISHDLGVVEHISDRVAIMYLGRIVEIAPTVELFAQPHHPYTQALLNEVPRISTTPREFSPMKGELPSPLNPPPGCHFHPRCPFAMARCRTERPELRQISATHASACHLND